jgi:hypothetical protein
VGGLGHFHEARIGFEAMLVLRDLRGLDLPQTEGVSRWLVRTLRRASLEGWD